MKTNFFQDAGRKCSCHIDVHGGRAGADCDRYGHRDRQRPERRGDPRRKRGRPQYGDGCDLYRGIGLSGSLSYRFSAHRSATR